MELLLMKNVEHLGRVGDVVKVKPGYARNYLLPLRFAVPVSAGLAVSAFELRVPSASTRLFGAHVT